MNQTKYGLRLLAIITFVIIGLCISFSSVYAQDNPNTITFDNQSGEPALVKLIGPTGQVIEVPNGEKRTVNVAIGEYYLLVRYGGKANQYSYTRGDPFTVQQTTTQYSAITITLHKVVGGNYPSRPTSREEFDKAVAHTQISDRPAMAQKENQTIVVDKKDFRVELSSVETKYISLVVGDFYLNIPVAAINTIRLAEDGKTLIVQSVTGKEVIGTIAEDIDSFLKGTWELGEYSVALSDIKFVSFARAVQLQQETTVADQPDGFYAICTDWTGAAMEMFDFRYFFSWYYSSRYINVRSEIRYSFRRYLPIKYKEAIVGIPFADIDMVEFTDNISTEREWKPTLNIKLRDGSTLTGELAQLGEYSPKFTGKPVNGDLIEGIHRIVFDHKRDKNAPRIVPLEEGDLYSHEKVGLNSKYTLSIKTWQGNQFLLLNGCRVDLDEGFKWIGLETNFGVKIGESSNTVDFDKIRSIQFLEKGKFEIRMTTASGKTIDASLDDKYSWLGGNLDKFGAVRIKISDVSSLEISRTAQEFEIRDALEAGLLSLTFTGKENGEKLEIKVKKMSSRPLIIIIGKGNTTFDLARGKVTIFTDKKIELILSAKSEDSLVVQQTGDVRLTSGSVTVQKTPKE